MSIAEAHIGMRVLSLVDFAGVPKGTAGVIDEDYGTGVTVRWDPRGQWERKHPLRDGFDKATELVLLRAYPDGVLS